MPYRLWKLIAVATATALAYGQAAAEESAPEPLPEPLTLEFALSQAEAAHPQLQASRNLIDSMEARRRQAESSMDLTTSLNGRIRWIGLPDNSTEGDHAVGISVNKPLLDFGVSENRERAASLYEDSARQQYIDTVQARREEIMRRYFDVLLADLQFYRENELMAVAFIRLDRARERQRLGQMDDLDILQLEREYQKVRRDRAYFEGQQRVTRARLASAINRPGRLSADLTRPELPQLERKAPEVEALQSLAMENNPQLIALRKEVEAAQAQLAATRKSDGLTVEAEMGYHVYTYQPPARDNWRLGLKFDYPISRGGRTEADIALALTDLHKAQNGLREAQMSLQQSVLEAWMELSTLRIERQEMQALYDYRGLKLDETRTRYEQEMQADLGDTMVLFTDAEWRLRRTEYQLALQWLKLEGLVGLPYEQFPRPEQDS